MGCRSVFKMNSWHTGYDRVLHGEHKALTRSEEDHKCLGTSFLFGLLGVLTEPKNNLFPLYPHRRMSRVIPPYLSELVATACSTGAAGELGWFYAHLFTGFPSQRRRGAGVLLSSASLRGLFLLWPQLVLGDQQAKLQPQRNAKYRCARGAARATQGAAVLEGCTLVMVKQWWAQRGPGGEGPAPHLCPQPPQSCWAPGVVIPISEQPVPPRH